MYVLYLLLMITNVVICADLPIIPPSTPPQDIKGRHCRNVSVANMQPSKFLNQKVKKDLPSQVPENDQEDIHDDLIFPMDE